MKTTNHPNALNCLGLVLLSGLLFFGCTKPPPFHYDFETEADLDALPWQCRLIFSLSEEHATTGKQCLKMAYFPNQPSAKPGFPGLSLIGFNPNWQNSSLLTADIFNPSDEPLTIGLRIDDKPDPPFDDRFNTELHLKPGANQISIPTAVLATSDKKRNLNLGSIRSVSLFYIKPESSQTLFLDNIKLEP